MPKKYYCTECDDSSKSKKNELHRVYMRTKQNNKDKWTILPLWICPECLFVHPDPFSKELDGKILGIAQSPPIGTGMKDCFSCGKYFKIDEMIPLNEKVSECESCNEKK